MGRSGESGHRQMESSPWILLFSGSFLAVTLFCFNFIGEMACATRLIQKTEPIQMSDLIRVRDLSVSFKTRHETILAVSRLNFELKENEILGIVGESGSGKSQTVLSIMGLLEPNGSATGEANFHGVNLLSLSMSELNRIRGKEIGMIFQDPMSSLNPYITIGSQMSQILAQHTDLTKKEREEKCVEMLDLVGITNPQKRFDGYSFELSGGILESHDCFGSFDLT